MKPVAIYTLKSKHRHILLAGLFIAGICNNTCLHAQDANAGKTIAQNRFQRLMKQKNTVLLDVRTPAEYTDGHIPRAMLVNVLDKEIFKKEIALLDKNKKYLLYCRSGKRSRDAKVIMKQMGFKRLYDLKDGINAWTGPKEQ